MHHWLELLAVLALFGAVAADTPANCTFEDVVGKWTLWEGPRGVKPGTDCVNHPGTRRSPYCQCRIKRKKYNLPWG